MALSMIWIGYKTRSFGSFRFNSFCWAVCIVWLVLVGSHSSELKILEMIWTGLKTRSFGSFRLGFHERKFV